MSKFEEIDFWKIKFIIILGTIILCIIGPFLVSSTDNIEVILGFIISFGYIYISFKILLQIYKKLN
jgi:hypothetical protein